ncbi:hypothetical protein ACFWRC_19520 [Streptomyces albidoflavus]
MSARDKIHARLFKGPNENRDDLIDELLREHAHELAEKARELMGPREMRISEPEKVARYVAGWHDAIDFIDPEVEK